MLIKLSLLVLIVFSSSRLFAGNICSPSKSFKAIDLQSEMGPPRDQDSIGWCYGFTGADLLGHYLYKTKAREVIGPDSRADYRSREFAVSAVGLSVFFNKERNKTYFGNIENVKSADELAKKYKKNVVAESGTIHEAILAAKKTGFCFEKDLPSENFGFVLDHRCAVKGKCNLDEMLKIVFDEAAKPNGCENNPAIKKLFPLLKEKTISTILTLSERMSAIDRLTSVACKKHFTKHLFDENKPEVFYETLNDPKSPKFQKGFAINTPNDLMNKIDAVLDKNSPVGISYYSEFLLKENGGDKAPHASSLIGKRFNPATCEVEYILRNSWGGHCDIYNRENPQYAPCTLTVKNETNPKVIYENTRKCRADFPPISRNSKVLCDPQTGNAYVSKSELMKHLYGLTYIKEGY
jgi:hypothetical protein